MISTCVQSVRIDQIIINVIHQSHGVHVIKIILTAKTFGQYFGGFIDSYIFFSDCQYFIKCGINYSKNSVNFVHIMKTDT